jgi:oxygen-dependent protoporphyrinogen oxidase
LRCSKISCANGYDFDDPISRLSNYPMYDVVIVGGGIAGLATAFELHRRNMSFAVLESSPRAGGVMLSEQIDGYTIDAGPDALLVGKPDGVRLCEDLGIADRLMPSKLPRLAYIQRGGKLYALPAASVLGIPTRWGPFIRTRLFSWPGKIRMGAEMFVPRREDESDESIGAFMRRRFGVEATEFLAEPLLAGIHAGDVDRLSISALFPRFVQAERKQGSLLRAFRRQPAPSADGPFRNLPGGLSEMIDALVRKLPAGSIRLNKAVSAVSVDRSEGVTFRVQTAPGDAFSARALVLASPSYVNAQLLRDMDPRISTELGSVAYASTATIAVAFPRDGVRHPLNGSGFVVPRSERTGLLAASWLSSKWPNRAPEGRVLLRAFVGGARDPKALERTDTELVSLACQALGSMLGITGSPLLSRVYRFNRANAQHEVGHLTRIAAIERALARHPGLYITGSGFRGVGIPDCVADGRATARLASEWLATTAAPQGTRA